MAASIITDTTNNRFVFTDKLTSQSGYNVTFNTEDTFVDKNLRVEIGVDSGTVSPYFDNTNLSTYFNTGTSSSNSISITPKATSVAGFINTLTTSSPHTGSASYYTIKAGATAADKADVNIFNTAGSNAGTNVYTIVGTKTDSEPNSGYYLAFKGEGNSKITTTGWLSSGSLAKATSAAQYFPLTAASVTHSGGDISITTNYSGTPTVSAALSSQTTSGVTLTTTEPSGGYYLTVTSSSSALSGKTKATRAAYTETFTEGYLPAKASTNILTSKAVEPSVNVNAGSGVSYLVIPEAVGTVTGTNTVTASNISWNQSNVTLSDTNNGISITATGGGTASVIAEANITTAGYLAANTNVFSGTLAAAEATKSSTKYISAITIPSSKSLTITNNGTATMTTSGTANITSTGATTVTSNSTTSGTITIAAKTATGDSSNTSQVVVQNGLWKTTAITASGTYYGRITVGSATVTTSSTNDGITTYFNEGTSSDKDVTITPKYTNTAGYKAAVTSATNNGGTTYWKIKTATPAFDGGDLSGGSTATGTNVTLSSTDNGIKIQTAYTASSAAVLYNGAVEGWVSKSDNAQALAGKSKGSTNGTAYYVTAITVPKDKGFTVTTTADTALDTTSDLDVTNAAYRRVDITNAANGSVIVSNAGDITTTQSAKTGTIKINAYDTGSASSLAGEKTIVENGAWKTTTITTKPSSATAYYGRVYVNLNTTSVTQTNTSVSGTTATRGTASWGTGWITSGSISAATFANSATSGQSYVDISNTTAAPVLVAGDYLYINKGYTDNLKISLAKLVPDSISDVSIATSEWIHPDYGAFDANGNEIKGSMTIYQGAYEVG